MIYIDRITCIHGVEVQKHPKGSELRREWIKAGEVWAG